MKLITSDNHQCAAAAFAMVLGISLEEMLNLLGHNGLQKINNLPEPYCFRGFHPAEFVDTLLNKSLSVIIIELSPYMIHGDQIEDHSKFLGVQRFYDSLRYGDGVILGSVGPTGHAVAWDSQTRMIYDPRGYVYEFPYTPNEWNFKPLQFLLVKEIHNGS